MRVTNSTAKKIVLQIASVLLIALVADYITDRTFPHHWIVYVIAGGLLVILLVAYLALGPDN